MTLFHRIYNRTGPFKTKEEADKWIKKDKKESMSRRFNYVWDIIKETENEYTVRITQIIE